VKTTSWKPNGQSIRSLWGQYRGDAFDFSYWKAEHDTELLAHFTPGGVFTPGTSYASSRIGSIHGQAKSMYQDILEAQGYNDYYSDPTLQAGYEWLYGYSHSPFGRALTFGDSPDSGTTYHVSGGAVHNSQILRADRYSPEAAQYAAWQLRESAGLGYGAINPKGRLLTFKTMAGPTTTDAVLAPSRIFDAYAGLIDKQQSTDALFAGMLSLTSSDGHSHKEANALALGGYGEHVLRNSGYNGWGSGVGLASWDWINNTAESGNTVVIDGVDHVSKTSGGISQGIVGGALEFARGDSGGALSNGDHQRDLIFIQPGDGVPGYWLVADHVAPDTPGDAVKAFWHPNSATLQTQSSGMQYLSDISSGPQTYGNNQVKLTTFLATPPQAVQVKQTTLANRASSFNAQYLAASYDTTSGSADALTVFFPHDQSHAVGSMSRIATGAYTGAVIAQGAVVDLALTSAGQAAGSLAGQTFQGEDVVSRLLGGEVAWYFVGEGTEFDDGALARTGFQADDAVSLFVDGETGSIVSPGTHVTIYQPGLGTLLIDDQAVLPIDDGSGWLEVFIPAGNHELELVTAVPNGDFDFDGIVDGADFLIWQRNFGMAGAGHSDGDADYDGDVDSFDLDIWQSGFPSPFSSFAAAVPEPQALVLLGWGLLLTMSKRPAVRRGSRCC
jgi:hypothetical protein